MKPVVRIAPLRWGLSPDVTTRRAGLQNGPLPKNRMQGTRPDWT